MNGRLYDARLGRFLSPDNNVQDPFGTQNFNRYAYALNNPMIYVDPDGEIIWWLVPAAVFLFFTDVGYEMQKAISPVAVKIDVSFGSNRRGVGVDVSVGIPQFSPIGFRAHAGASYYWRNYGITPGWEFRYGAEMNFTPFIVMGFTHYDSPGSQFDQRVGYARLGMPLFNVQYANDWFFGIPTGDGGDRYRTTAVRLRLGLFEAGINLFTGDPGHNPRDRMTHDINGRETYIPNERGDDPDSHRAGVFYVGFGPFRFGRDSESVRHFVQNQVVHNLIDAPYFRVLPRRGRWFYEFGSGRLW